MNLFKYIPVIISIFYLQLIPVHAKSIDKGPVAIIAEFTIAPGKEKELLGILLKHAQLTVREEPGCLRFEVLKPVDEKGLPVPNRLYLSELYVNKAAMEAHERSPRVVKTIARMQPLLRELKVNIATGLSPLGQRK